MTKSQTCRLVKKEKIGAQGKHAATGKGLDLKNMYEKTFLSQLLAHHMTLADDESQALRQASGDLFP